MKAKIIVGRGTATKEIEIVPSKWSGDSFRSYQEEVMEGVPESMKMSVGKGTQFLLASKYPKSKAKLPSGGYLLSIARGTATRRL